MGAQKKYVYVIDIIAMFFMFVFGKIVPPFGPVTDVGVGMIGVFIGLVLLTVCTKHMFFATLMSMIAMIYCGYTTANDAFVSWLGNSTIATFIFVSAFVVALRETGAMNVLAKKILSLKVLHGRPKLFIAAFLLTTFVISMFLKFAPTIVLMFGLFESIRDICGYDKKDAFCKYILLGLFMACMGSYALPFMGIQMTSIALANSAMEAYGIVFNEMTYFVTNVAIFVPWLLIYILGLGKILKCDLNPLKNLDITQAESMKEISDKFNGRQKIMMGVFAFCIAELVLTALCPAAPVISVFAKLGTGWIWVAVLAVLSIFTLGGKPVVVPQKVLEPTMWNIVCMIGAFSMLGSAIASEELGIRNWIIDVISPIFGNMSLPVMLILVVVVITLATNFLNGLPLTLAMTATVLPFVCQMQLDYGISASVMGTIFNVCANMAYLTAAGSIYSSLILGREEMDTKWIWTKGLVVLCGFMIVTICVGLVLCYLLP